jgi:hypothetical protein
LKYIDALFGTFKDAYTVLKGNTTALDANDTAIVLTGDGNMQLFLPENGEISDRALALVEIYNALCRERIGPIDKHGRPIAENIPYQGFSIPFTQRMKARFVEGSDATQTET